MEEATVPPLGEVAGRSAYSKRVRPAARLGVEDLGRYHELLRAFENESRYHGARLPNETARASEGCMRKLSDRESRRVALRDRSPEARNSDCARNLQFGGRSCAAIDGRLRRYRLIIANWEIRESGPVAHSNNAHGARPVRNARR